MTAHWHNSYVTCPDPARDLVSHSIWRPTGRRKRLKVFVLRCRALYQAKRVQKKLAILEVHHLKYIPTTSLCLLGNLSDS